MKETITSSKAEIGLSRQPDSAAVAVQEKITVGAGGVVVKGNVDGNIQITNKKIEVHADHGAVVNLYDAAPRVKKRDAIPQPARPIRGFVNRVSELKQIERIVTGGEVATIQGMDGMGKSALLRQAANTSVARALPDGVLFIEGIDERGQTLGLEDVIQRLFDKSFESDPHLKVNFDTAQTYLGNLRSLVVLNGLDLSGSSLPLATDLFARGSVLVETSRSIENEIAEEIRLGPLPRTEAMELLAAKAGVTQDENAHEILDAICALLADVPLALVMAGRAIRENSLTLKKARNMLVLAQPQSAEANRRGIERAYILAQSTLTNLEKQWLAAAAFAPGISIDPKFLHQLAGDEAAAAQAQKRMQAMGLLTANSPRLRIDQGVRELARMGMDETSLQEQFLDYLKSMLRTRSLDWSYCTDELGNILGMIDWAANQQRSSDVIALGRAIDPYLTLHGLWEAWRAMLEDVLQSARQIGDRVNEAWALHQLGTRAIGVGLAAQAIDFLQQALHLRSELGDAIGMTFTRHNLDLLIPPTSSNNDSGQPPDNPVSPGRAVKLLLKTSMIVAMLAASTYWAVHALNAPSIPPTPDPGVPITGPTDDIPVIPTLTATKIPTFTPSRTPTKTPTETATSTHTATPTASPTEVASGIGVPQLSTAQLYFRGERCDPSRITIRVPAQHPAGVKVMVFFHRLHEVDSGRDSGWSDGLSMNTKGDGVYVQTVSGDTLIGDSGIRSQAWGSYQFVIQSNDGEWIRSTVYTDLSLVPCGGGGSRPPVTATIEVTTVPPPPVTDYGLPDETVDYGSFAGPTPEPPIYLR
jgi:tetratricopeptide (TPR) repeat protein